jgi:hypothetical protein
MVMNLKILTCLFKSVFSIFFPDSGLAGMPLSEEVIFIKALLKFPLLIQILFLLLLQLDLHQSLNLLIVAIH